MTQQPQAGKKLALSVGLYFRGNEPTRAEEYEAVQKAGNFGYNKVLEDRSSDEQVFLVERELLTATLNHDTDETLEASLKEAGYEVVDLYAWLETQPYEAL